MTPQHLRNLRRARELDDGEPDLICPGCRGDITGWPSHYGHLRGTRRVPVRFWDSYGAVTASQLMCAWTRDYLSARMHRRALLREAVERGEMVVQ